MSTTNQETNKPLLEMNSLETLKFHPQRTRIMSFEVLSRVPSASPVFLSVQCRSERNQLQTFLFPPQHTIWTIWSRGKKVESGTPNCLEWFNFCSSFWSTWFFFLEQSTGFYWILILFFTCTNAIQIVETLYFQWIDALGFLIPRMHWEVWNTIN